MSDCVAGQLPHGMLLDAPWRPLFLNSAPYIDPLTSVVNAGRIILMKNGKTTPHATRGYAPDKKALARLVAAGVSAAKVYEAEKGQTPDKFKMRNGEYLGVVNGLLAFGKGRREIDRLVRKFHAEGASILDVETGLDSREHGVRMMNEAMDPPKPSKEYMAELARQRGIVSRIAKGMMLERDAIVIWRNPKFSVTEALDLMHGWRKDTAYRTLGRRDVPAGRRPK